MDEIKKVTSDDIKNLAAKTAFNERILIKDYYLTLILFRLRTLENIFFKGGTALQKTILGQSRLSEDIDFTVTGDLKKVEKSIKGAIGKEEFISRIGKDKSVDKFVRVVVYYNNLSGDEDTIFIDLNQRAKLLKKPEKHKINHFYKGFIPEFSSNTLSSEEMVAEKLAAAIGRNKPRDHFDIYMMLKKNIPLDLVMAKKKCESSGHAFSVIRMFNRAKKLKNRWDEDLLPLLAEEVSFQEVMKTLAKHFKLKEEKERLK